MVKCTRTMVVAVVVVEVVVAAAVVVAVALKVDMVFFLDDSQLKDCSIFAFVFIKKALHFFFSSQTGRS